MAIASLTHSATLLVYSLSLQNVALLWLHRSGNQACSLAGWPSCSVPHCPADVRTPLLDSEWPVAAWLVSSSVAERTL